MCDKCETYKTDIIEILSRNPDTDSPELYAYQEKHSIPESSMLRLIAYAAWKNGIVNKVEAMYFILIMYIADASVGHRLDNADFNFDT